MSYLTTLLLHSSKKERIEFKTVEGKRETREKSINFTCACIFVGYSKGELTTSSTKKYNRIDVTNSTNPIFDVSFKCVREIVSGLPKRWRCPSRWIPSKCKIVNHCAIGRNSDISCCKMNKMLSIIVRIKFYSFNIYGLLFYSCVSILH